MRVLPISPAWPRAHSVHRACLKFRDLPASVQELGLKTQVMVHSTDGVLVTSQRIVLQSWARIPAFWGGLVFLFHFCMESDYPEYIMTAFPKNPQKGTYWVTESSRRRLGKTEVWTVWCGRIVVEVSWFPIKLSRAQWGLPFVYDLAWVTPGSYPTALLCSLKPQVWSLPASA